MLTSKSPVRVVDKVAEQHQYGQPDDPHDDPDPVVTFDLTLEVTVVPDPILGAQARPSQQMALVLVPLILDKRR